MMHDVLVLDCVSKRYVTYSSTLKRIGSWLKLNVQTDSEFVASHDISFRVAQGEAVAIIGQNGAGKSTLLKMITGTVRPSTGTISVSGRVSAILELGLGFNLEFTGRQNIFHAGGLMGFSQVELRSLAPHIQEFAELGEYFDQPMRTYSSGMIARLAFSLATASRPDVLIVDEVLSVGDSYFQHKSFARIREFKEEGTSILLVTHGLADVRALCNRVVLLDRGVVVKDGPPDEVVDYYNAMIAERENAKLTIEQRRDKNGWLKSEFGTREAVMEAFALVDRATGEPVATARVGQKLRVRSRVRIAEPVDNLVIGHRLTDRTGHVIWGTNTGHTRQILSEMEPGQAVDIALDFDCELGPGSYAINYGLHRSHTTLDKQYHKAENSIVFDVVNLDRNYFIGSSALNGVFTLDINHE